MRLRKDKEKVQFYSSASDNRDRADIVTLSRVASTWLEMDRDWLAVGLGKNDPEKGNGRSDGLDKNGPAKEAIATTESDHPDEGAEIVKKRRQTEETMRKTTKMSRER